MGRMGQMRRDGTDGDLHQVSKDDRLRVVALIAVLLGAVGSMGLFFHAIKHPPLVILVLFVVWILAPYVVFLWATVISKRWTALTRTTLYSVMIVVTIGSLAVYVRDAIKPRKSQPAAVYVLVPPASGLLAVIAVSIAALRSRTRR